MRESVANWTAFLIEIGEAAIEVWPHASPQATNAAKATDFISQVHSATNGIEDI